MSFIYWGLIRHFCFHHFWLILIVKLRNKCVVVLTCTCPDYFVFRPRLTPEKWDMGAILGVLLPQILMNLIYESKTVLVVLLSVQSVPAMVLWSERIVIQLLPRKQRPKIHPNDLLRSITLMGLLSVMIAWANVYLAPWKMIFCTYLARNELHLDGADQRSLARRSFPDVQYAHFYWWRVHLEVYLANVPLLLWI